MAKDQVVYTSREHMKNSGDNLSGFPSKRPRQRHCSQGPDSSRAPKCERERRALDLETELFCIEIRNDVLLRPRIYHCRYAEAAYEASNALLDF